MGPLQVWRTDLGATIAGQCVVPQAFVGSRDGSLVMIMVTMGSGNGCKSYNSSKRLHLDYN